MNALWKIREQEKVRPSFTNLEGINVPHISKNIRIQAVHSYIAGYVMRSIRKITSNCLECATFLKNEEACKPEHFLIEVKEYSRNKLFRPNSAFLINFSECIGILHVILPKICHKRNIKNYCISMLQKHIQIDESLFNKHNLKDIFLIRIVIFFIHTWIRNINKSLKGLDYKKYYKSNILNPIAKLAQKRYVQYKTKNKKIKMLKRLV